MKTKYIDNSSDYRRLAYHLQLDGETDRASYYARIADALEAKEPLAWQPAGTISIAQLLNPKNTK